MDKGNPTDLCQYLSRYDQLIEIGIGHRSDVAATLTEMDCDVLAVDLIDRPVPAGVRFFVDDVNQPTISQYRGADAIYALNLPEELHRSVLTLATTVDAAFHFTTLGNEEPIIPVDRHWVGGELLFTAL